MLWEMEMRCRPALLLFALIVPGISHAADAQPSEQPVRPDCNGFVGVERSKCIADNKRAGQQAAKSGSGDKHAKLVNETNAAASTKVQAGDFAGAIALYDQVLAAADKTTPRHFLLIGKAAAQRRQGIAAYNSAGTAETPPPGSSNEVIRAANAANATLQTRKSAAALPLFSAALATAAEAASFADHDKNKGADEAIGSELREDASLIFRLDHAHVMTTVRPSIDIEAAWLRRWLAADPTLGNSLVAKFGVAVAAALVAKDPTAGLALADEIHPRLGNDPDGTIGYAEIVVAAKTPVADPHRAKALAGLTAIEASVVGSQKTRLTELKLSLAAS